MEGAAPKIISTEIPSEQESEQHEGGGILAAINRMIGKWRLALGVAGVLSTVPAQSLAQSREKEEVMLRLLAAEGLPNKNPLKDEITSDSEDIAELVTQIDVAYFRNNYIEAAKLFDKLDSIISKSNITITPKGWVIILDIFANAGRHEAVEEICDQIMNIAKYIKNSEKTAWLEVFGECAMHLIDTDPPENPEKGLRYLLAKYALQTGSSDQQILLKKIAFNVDDALRSLRAMMALNRNQEAADILVFYWKMNPSLLNRPTPDLLLRIAIKLEERGIDSAYSYYNERETDERWRKNIDGILKWAIPAGIIIGGAIAIDRVQTRKTEQEEADRKKRAEEDERRRQAERAAENARRRAQGLPTLEEERERERERIGRQCREQCETNFHGCIGNMFGDEKYESVCHSNLAGCRAMCP